MPPTISIITAVRNGAATITECIESVQSQTYPVEHIIIDGASTDNTLEIINRYRSGIARFVSEPDHGIYDAMNKGINLATGDVIGILNADDYYIDTHVIEKVANSFDTLSIDALFADLVYVRPDNLDKVVRYYSCANFTLAKIASGWMPPHPTFFVRKECYLKYGLFKTDYKLAADYELMARFLVKYGISFHYLPEVLIKMRTGGASTKNLQSTLILNREILRACTDNGISTNLLRIYSKYFSKCRQLFERPR